MQYQRAGYEPAPESLDADAVCSQCHTVNADGALICATCGNNLRDQRAERLGAEEMLIGAEKGQVRKWIFRVCAGLAGLCLVLMALNPGAVTDWLVRIQTSAPPDGRILWRGDDGAFFDSLAAQLDPPPSRESVRAAMRTPAFSNKYEGTYILRKGREVLGFARAAWNGDTLFIAAKIGDKDEVRVKAQQQGRRLSAPPGNAGALIGGAHIPLAGGAQPQPDGTIRCIGRSEASNETYVITAFRLAE